MICIGSEMAKRLCVMRLLSLPYIGHQPTLLRVLDPTDLHLAPLERPVQGLPGWQIRRLNPGQPDPGPI